MTNSQNTQRDPTPPPPSYDESQRGVYGSPNQSTYQQPLLGPSSAPHTVTFAPSAPNINFYNPPSTSSSLPFSPFQPSQPSQQRELPKPHAPLSFFPFQPSQPPQLHQQRWPSIPSIPSIPSMEKFEKKIIEAERKLTKTMDKLDHKLNATGTKAENLNMNRWERKVAHHQNKVERMFSEQGAKIEKEMNKFSKTCTSQGDFFTREMNKLGKKHSSRGPSSLLHCAQPKTCACSYYDRGISCSSTCIKYPLASTSSSHSADPNYYYSNSTRKY